MKLYRFLILLFMLIIFSSTSYGIDGLTVGISFGVVPDQFGLTGDVFEQNAGQFAVKNFPLSDAILDGNFKMLDKGRGSYDPNAAPLGMKIAMDIKYRYSFLFLRTGVSYEPNLSGGENTITFHTNKISGLSDGTDFVIAQQASGWILCVPFNIGVYIPVFESASVYGALGPAMYTGEIIIESQLSKNAANIVKLGGFAGDDYGLLDFTATGLGFQAIMGVEYEIFTNLSIYFDFILDIFASFGEWKIEGNDVIAEQYLPDGVTPNPRYKPVPDKKRWDHNVNSGFDELSNKYHTYVDEHGDTIARFPVNSVGFRMGFGVQYKLF